MPPPTALLNICGVAFCLAHSIGGLLVAQVSLNSRKDFVPQNLVVISELGTCTSKLLALQNV